MASPEVATAHDEVDEVVQRRTSTATGAPKPRRIGPGTVHADARDVMHAIDLHDAEPPRSHSPYRVPAQPGLDCTLGLRNDTDPAMIFATVTLLVASLIRLAPPFAGYEAFGVETTLALGCTLGCGWVALREVFFRLKDICAACRSRRIVRCRTIDGGPRLFLRGKAAGGRKKQAK